MFTRNERMVLIFLMASLLVGSGVTLFKRFQPGIAPDLPVEIIREEKDPLDFQNPDTSASMESALGVEGSLPEESPEVIEEVIEKTEDRIHGKYPEIRVNINTASRRELMLLPRIGPKMADRILAYREGNGPFRSKEEIMKVKGIGEKTFEDLKELIVVE